MTFNREKCKRPPWEYRRIVPCTDEKTEGKTLSHCILQAAYELENGKSVGFFERGCKNTKLTLHFKLPLRFILGVISP